MPFPLSSSSAAQVKDLNDEFMAAFKSQDAQRLSQLYCTNGKALPAGMARLEGRTAIAKLFQGVMDMGVKTVVLDADEVFGGDSSQFPDIIFECAKWTFKDGEGKVIDAGKFLTILHQEEGKYKYLYDMFSSNGPIQS